MSALTRIGIGPLLSGRFGSVALPDEVSLFCPQCGTPVADKGQCSVELRKAQGESKTGFVVELVVVDCRACGCDGKAPGVAFGNTPIAEETNKTKIEQASLAGGTVSVGGTIFWLNPVLCDRPATEASQRRHIEEHGPGPFTVSDIIRTRSGNTLICFKDIHGNNVEINSDWFVAD